MLPITHETELKHFALGFGVNPLRRTGWRGPLVWAGWTWPPHAWPRAKLGDTSLEIPCAWPCATLPRPHLQDFTPWKRRSLCSGAGGKAGNQLLGETHLNTGGHVAFPYLCVNAFDMHQILFGPLLLDITRILYLSPTLAWREDPVVWPVTTILVPYNQS